MATQATVLIPTHDHAGTLALAVRSALNQTVEGIEIFIVGDGVSPEVRSEAELLLREDQRIRFFDNPKGASRGELHRHAALADANGEIVCYLSDDDLWFPDHVATMVRALKSADFAHTIHVTIRPNGQALVLLADLGQAYYYNSVMSKRNRFGLSFGAHTLDMYRKLPHGWRTTPAGMPTDHYMWQQFLAHPECRAVTEFHPTALHFAAPDRRDWSTEQRRAELESWYAKLSDPQQRLELIYEIQRSTVAYGTREIIKLHSEVQKLKNARVLRWHNALVRIPVLGTTIRWLGRLASRF